MRVCGGCVRERIKIKSSTTPPASTDLCNLHLSHLSFPSLLYFSSQKNTQKPARKLPCPSLSNTHQPLSFTLALEAGTSFSSRKPPPLCLSQRPRSMATTEPLTMDGSASEGARTRKDRPTPCLSSDLPGSLLKQLWSRSRVPSDPL